MTDIFGIIPDAKPPKGKEGHIQDIFGTWVPAPQARQEPRQKPYHKPKQQKPRREERKESQEPKKRGYVAESYIQTGKDIVKGVRLGVRGVKYLNKKRKEYNEKKEFKPDSTKTMKDKEFKIKQDY